VIRYLKQAAALRILAAAVKPCIKGSREGIGEARRASAKAWSLPA
jgi:hypothetical protein